MITALAGVILLGVTAAGPGLSTPDLPALIADLRSPDVEVRRKAAFVLYNEARLAEKYLSQLIEAYADPDPTVRASLASFFAVTGPKAKAAVPLLLNDAKAKDAHLRRRVVNALGLIQSESDVVVPVLMALVDDADPGAKGTSRVGVMAVRALSWHGPQARSAVPFLLDALKARSEEKDIRNAIIHALGKIGGDHPLLVPTLLAHLDGKLELFLREAAVIALGRLGSQAKSAIPKIAALIDLEEPEARWTRERAIWALGEMGDEVDDSVVRKLLPLLKAKTDDPVRITVIRTLGKLGPKHAKMIVPGLIDVLAEMPNIAIPSLAAMGKEAVAPLIPFVDDYRDENFQICVLRTLALIGPPAKDALPALQKVLKESRDERVLDLAREAVQKIERR